MIFKKKLIPIMLSASLLLSSNAAFALDYNVNVNALHYAVSINKVGYVEDLIKDEPTLVVQYNKEGLTPIHIAITSDSLSSLKAMLKNKANPNIKNAFGETPLTYAIKNGKYKASKILIENGANPKIRDRDGFSSKEYAQKEPKFKSLFEKAQLKQVDFAPISQSIDIEKLKSEILKENKSIINKLIVEQNVLLKEKEAAIMVLISDIEARVSELENDIGEIKMASKTNAKNIELADINIIDIEEELSLSDGNISSIRDSLIEIELKSEEAIKDIKELKARELSSMYNNQPNVEEQDIILVTYDNNNIENEVVFEEETLDLVNFENGKDVPLGDMEDNSLEYK